MGKFSLDDIRSALIKGGYLTVEKSEAISDEQLQKSDFCGDLNMDSLDVILLAQDLEQDSCLVIPEDGFWDCKTVQDVLNLNCENVEGHV